MINLDELERLEKAATPGPWDIWFETSPNEVYLSKYYRELSRDEDAKFISALRNSAVEMIKELKAARNFVDQFGPGQIDILDWAKVVIAAKLYDKARDWGEDE